MNLKQNVVQKVAGRVKCKCFLFAFTLATWCCFGADTTSPTFSAADCEGFISNLLGRMTLTEKLGQIQQVDGTPDGGYLSDQIQLVRDGRIGSMLNVRGVKPTTELQRVAMKQSRLKIPVLFAFDVIHGYRTIFPVPLGEAASWDPSVAERSASIAADETSAAGVRWTFAPMVDIARDPRWGRIVEGAGEDPFLGAAIATARVLGFQGADYSQPGKIVGCAKHWVAYGAVEGGRDYNTTEVSEHTLREIYFPPFKAALDAGVGTFMSAFTDLDGVPCTANPFTLTQVLRKEWRFDGFVVSDYGAVKELLTHGVAADGPEAALKSLTAGLDMEMASHLVNESAPQLVKDGRLPLGTIDEAVRRILRIKYRLGLFQNPYGDSSRERSSLLAPDHLAAARELAGRTFVLLKNDRETLPLSRKVKSIAVIGPLADDAPNVMGSWPGDGRAEDAVTLLAGLRARVAPATKINYEKGCEVTGDSHAGFDSALRAAKASDFIILAVGESAAMSGEAASRADLDLPGVQLDLIRLIHATGKPYAVVLMNGRPLTINWVAEHSPAILETWFAGTEAGNAIVDALFGDVNPGGKLPVTFPRSVGQIPLYYNHKNTGRPSDTEGRFASKYIDEPWTPLYPFGFGLSYTQFKLGNLQLSANQISSEGDLKVSVDLVNTGKRDGDEVVQLYLHAATASVTRPVRELKGFQRVTLKAGEGHRVEFTLTPRELGCYDAKMQFMVEPGRFQVYVGTSSDGGLEGNFEVTKN